MPRPPNPERRRAVLDQVVDHLLRTGVSGASLRPVAAALGVSTYTLSYQFGSRDGLLQAVATEVLERQRRLVNTRLELASGPEAAILDAWEAMRAHLDHDRLLLELSVVRGLPVSTETQQAISRTWVDALTTLLVQHGFDERHAEQEATLLQATFWGLQIDLSNTGDHQRIDAAVARLAHDTAARWR